MTVAPLRAPRARRGPDHAAARRGPHRPGRGRPVELAARPADPHAQRPVPAPLPESLRALRLAAQLPRELRDGARPRAPAAGPGRTPEGRRGDRPARARPELAAPPGPGGGGG